MKANAPEKYIPKSALVAEIQKRINFNEKLNAHSRLDECNAILSFIDTLEVKELPIWEKVSSDTGQTTLYKDEGKSYLERFGYRIDLKDLDKLPKKNLKAQKED